MIATRKEMPKRRSNVSGSVMISSHNRNPPLSRLHAPRWVGRLRFTIIVIVTIFTCIVLSNSGALAQGTVQITDDNKKLIYLLVVAGTIILGGAFGGLIYSINSNRGAINLHSVKLQEETCKSEYVKWNLGIYGDMLVGAGGGIIAFNLIPHVTDSGLIESLWKNIGNVGLVASIVVKILSLSLIGGFAGISLFDEAARRISKQMQKVSEQVDANSSLLSNLNQDGTTESEIRLLLNRAVDKTLSPLGPNEVDKLRIAVIKAPLQVRNFVFDKCQQAVELNRILGSSIEMNKLEIQSRMTQLKGLIHCFDSLLAAAVELEKETKKPDLNTHRYLAHIGFIYKNLAIGSSLLQETDSAKESLTQAEKLLGLAIESRDKQSTNAEQEFWHYSLDRSFCRFRLGLQVKAMEDLHTPKAMSWPTSLAPGLVFTNLKGFRSPPLSGDVTPSPYVDNEFFVWLASIRPELVPLELLAQGTNLNRAKQNGDLPMGQRDDEDVSQENNHFLAGNGQVALANVTSPSTDPDHAQFPP